MLKCRQRTRKSLQAHVLQHEHAREGEGCYTRDSLQGKACNSNLGNLYVARKSEHAPRLKKQMEQVIVCKHALLATALEHTGLQQMHG